MTDNETPVSFNFGFLAEKHFFGALSKQTTEKVKEPLESAELS